MEGYLFINSYSLKRFVENPGPENHNIQRNVHTRIPDE